MAEVVKKIAPWQPTKKQRKWIEKKAKANKANGVSGGIGQVMSDAINSAMDGKNVSS